MKEIRNIANNISQYVFWEKEDQTGIEVNITVLLHQDHALILDTAFSRHARQVKRDLQSKGITATKIILSHYHPDHAAGATEFPNAELYCSEHYMENYTNCAQLWDTNHPYRKADLLLRDCDELRFGSFTLRFLETPGHSKCSLTTVINDTLVHVGDLLMSDPMGLPTLPYISEDGNFIEHIKSLERIKTLPAEQLILSHGSTITGEEAILRSIEARIHYLKETVESDGTAELQALLAGNMQAWAYTNWHAANLKTFHSQKE